jgi:hypothetical protein
VPPGCEPGGVSSHGRCGCARAGILVRPYLHVSSPKNGGCLSVSNRPPRWPIGKMPRRGDQPKRKPPGCEPGGAACVLFDAGD